ncbi:MAG TPA: c-type cytochrome [Thiobacillaceae bacterium]|nr:c-type cytochrome [Thiobacillaceae bacterium]
MKLLSLVAATALMVAVPAFANQELAQKNGCLACHSVDKKVVGPAYKDVAKKYAKDKGAAAKLFTKVKKGGSGVWGPVAMPPNPQVKDADLKKIIAWILSQK